MAAAVADFRPKRAADGKLKKETGAPELELEPTPDILARARGVAPARTGAGGVRGRDQRCRGGGPRRSSRARGVDLLVANEVGASGNGIRVRDEPRSHLDAAGDDVALRDWTKAELAARDLSTASWRT